jgi:hypothetical protein
MQVADDIRACAAALAAVQHHAAGGVVDVMRMVRRDLMEIAAAVEEMEAWTWPHNTGGHDGSTDACSRRDAR